MARIPLRTWHINLPYSVYISKVGLIGIFLGTSDIIVAMQAQDLFPRVPRGVGIDIIEISRFERFGSNRSHRFLTNVFSAEEIEYCFGYVDFATHLAGTFAAKEAASKALGTGNYPLQTLSVRRGKFGKPEILCRDGSHAPVLISISHAGGIAAAIATKTSV